MKANKLFLFLSAILFSICSTNAQIIDSIQGRYSGEIDFPDFDIESIFEKAMEKIDLSQGEKVQKGTEEFANIHSKTENGVAIESQFAEIEIKDSTISLKLPFSPSPAIHTIKEVENMEDGCLFVTTKGRTMYIKYDGNNAIFVFNQLKLILHKL
ncbi:MAG: hypothetical protein LBR17_01950 [Bacteroidales bacterium]|jgi:hypothetical protein|nr:hypothetical protein [Bacteroidales bacterium]